jgi:acyl carrier protein phosphodiesterase
MKNPALALILALATLCSAPTRGSVFEDVEHFGKSLVITSLKGVSEVKTLSTDAINGVLPNIANSAVSYVNSSGKTMLVAADVESGILLHIATDEYSVALSSVNDLKTWYQSVQVVIDGVELDLSKATQFADEELNQALTQVLIDLAYADRLVVAQFLAIFNTFKQGKLAESCDKFLIEKSASVQMPIPALQNAVFRSDKIPPTIATLLQAETRVSNAVGKGFVAGWYCGNLAWVDTMTNLVKDSVQNLEQALKQTFSVGSEIAKLSYKFKKNLGDQQCNNLTTGRRGLCALNKTAIDFSTDTGSCLKDTGEYTLALFVSAVNTKLADSGSSNPPQVAALADLMKLESYLTSDQFTALLSDLALLSARVGSFANNSAAVQVLGLFTAGADEEVEAPVTEEFAYESFMDENQAIDLLDELKRAKSALGKINTTASVAQKGRQIAIALMDGNPQCTDLEGLMGGN